MGLVKILNAIKEKKNNIKNEREILDHLTNPEFNNFLEKNGLSPEAVTGQTIKEYNMANDEPSINERYKVLHELGIVPKKGLKYNSIKQKKLIENGLDSISKYEI